MKREFHVALDAVEIPGAYVHPPPILVARSRQYTVTVSYVQPDGNVVYTGTLFFVDCDVAAAFVATVQGEPA